MGITIKEFIEKLSEFDEELEMISIDEFGRVIDYDTAVFKIGLSDGYTGYPVLIVYM